MITNIDNSIEIDGFLISQDLHNQITATALFGIEKKDDTHLCHDDIKWAINSDIICNGCNICDSCQGDCHSSCQGTCTSGCQGSCHSSCQGGCTSKCQGCIGCHGGCTSKCNNGCYSGCTSKCVGCHSCNACQICVGAACVSCNGSCTGSVQIQCNSDQCTGCYLKAQGCTSCVNGQGCNQAKPKAIVTPPNIKSVKCSCYGCQNTVGGGEGCGNDYGYNTPNTLEVVIEKPDGSTATVKITVKGEAVVSGGGSKRDEADLADAIRAFAFKNGYKVSNDTEILLTKENNSTVESTTWGSISGKTNQYVPVCYSATSMTLPLCMSITSLGCGVVTGPADLQPIGLPPITGPVCLAGTGFNF